jgi:prepilin-type N-terminal cleavage/methylation domain-containing protein
MRGFTLLELLLATLVLSIIGTLTWGALSATFQTQRTVSQRTELQEVGTSVLMKLKDDLAQTFHVEAPKPLTFFKGEDSFEHDRLNFTALAHYPTGADRKESDQCEITYEMESDPQSMRLYRLKRREVPYLDGDPNEGGDFVTLASNVVSFNLEYLGDQQWFPSWDIRDTDHLNKLPKAVRVSVVLQDEKERTEAFEAVIDIPMGEPLSVEVTPTPNPTPQGRPRQQSSTP